MVEQQDTIRHSREAPLYQLVQIAGAKIERETDERGKLVVGYGQPETIRRKLPQLQSPGLLLRNRLALLNALTLCHVLWRHCFARNKSKSLSVSRCIPKLKRNPCFRSSSVAFA
jgi:hypothetical protein